MLESYTKEQIVESVSLSKAQSNFLKKSYKQSKRKKRLFWNRYESNWYNPIDNHGWRLPATKDPRENCGKFVTKGCLNKSNHPGRKNWIKHCELSCFRKDCSVCFEKWLDRASNRATRRIEKYEKISGKPAKHIIISPPKWHSGNRISCGPARWSGQAIIIARILLKYVQIPVNNADTP